MQSKLSDDYAEDLILKKIELDKGSSYLSATFYFFMFLILILFSASFFFFTYRPDLGFEAFIAGILLGVPAFGIKSYDNLSRVLLVVFSVGLGIALITLDVISASPLVYLYYLGLALTIYTLVVDKRTHSLFMFNFNKDLLKLHIILVAMYLYLALDAVLNLDRYINQSPELLMVYYGFLLYVFVNLAFVQLRSANARILMIITSIILIVVSLAYILTDYYRIIAIVLSILMIAELLLDKKAIAVFKVIDNETYYFFKVVYVLNLANLIIISIAILYNYSDKYIVNDLIAGFVFVIFYFICLYKVNRYSYLWKNIFSVLLLGVLAVSLYDFQQSIALTVFLVPISFLTLFALNLDYQTKFLFSHMKKLKENFA